MSYKLSVIFILCTFFARDFITAYSGPKNSGPKDPGLIKNIEPNYDAVKGLICYQCRSLSTELQPLCDRSMFRFSTPEEKYNMSLLCPSYQGAYCFTKVWTEGKVTETIRGCSGPTDINGEEMKVGCLNRKQGYFCLCNTKFCNTGDMFLPQIGIIIIFYLVCMILK